MCVSRPGFALPAERFPPSQERRRDRTQRQSRFAVRCLRKSWSAKRARRVVRAVRITEPLRIDGRLDEAVYSEVPSISDFIQTVPNEGAPATERTEAWVMFDDNSSTSRPVLGLGAAGPVGRQRDAARHQPAAPERQVRRAVRHVPRSPQRLHVLHEPARRACRLRRSPTKATRTSTGTRCGTSRTGRFEGGWTVEIAIPFKSMRYRSGADQTWGIQLRRGIRRKNEWALPDAVPASTGGVQGIFRVSAGGDAGRPRPAAGEQEPRDQAVRHLAARRPIVLRAPVVAQRFDGDVGGDVKYGVTANLTADFTDQHRLRAGRGGRAAGQPDALQPVVSREARVLPRGPRHLRLRRGGSGQRRRQQRRRRRPQLFYSRRIGLNRNRVVPIDVGGRLTGKVGQVRRRAAEHPDGRRAARAVARRPTSPCCA